MCVCVCVVCVCVRVRVRACACACACCLFGVLLTCNKSIQNNVNPLMTLCLLDKLHALYM